MTIEGNKGFPPPSKGPSMGELVLPPSEPMVCPDITLKGSDMEYDTLATCK